MPDLHGWITQQIDAAASAATRWHDIECDVHATTLIDAAVIQGATLCDCGGPAAVLRRCAADRKILVRHRPFENLEIVDLPKVGHVIRCAHDKQRWPCPDITDLAEGWGWTEEPT